MAPNSSVSNAEQRVEHPVVPEPKRRVQIVWFNAILYIILHLSALYGFYLAFTATMIKTLLFAVLWGNFGILGITAGSHRLWAHRSYKARLPLRILLCMFASVSGQNDIFEWCRDHRVHHKYSETDADPHNIKRGFFFAHVGWLLCKKHPEVMAKGKGISLDDLWEDPVVRFHRKYYKPMFITFSFILPTVIPAWLWGESVWNAFFVVAMGRYCATLNFTWLVNSAAHKYGIKPFDKQIEAADNFLISMFMNGEGWHNYHHVFPWDYSASELGYKLNFTKLFIDFMSWIGLAYDLKTVPKEMILKKKIKSGDGTRLGSDDESRAAVKEKLSK